MRTEGFLRQTAQDYDMDYEDVKWISERHSDDFYEALERFIQNRAEAVFDTTMVETKRKTASK